MYMYVCMCACVCVCMCMCIVSVVTCQQFVGMWIERMIVLRNKRDIEPGKTKQVGCQKHYKQ